ncbi:MAG: DUF6273 domain-containing protein, partial [Coriobacteriales bacterium]|nr:DUF6273 domain-containing protein [Coriobacteriales bacterium]
WRKAEEERLAKEKAEREKAEAEARKATAVRHADFVLAMPSPNPKALREALVDLQSLPQDDYEVKRLEERLKSRLRLVGIRQVVPPFAVVAIVVICIALWPRLQSAMHPKQSEPYGATTSSEAGSVSAETDDLRSEESLSGLVDGVNVKSGVNDYSWGELKALSQAIAEADEDKWLDIAKSYNLVDADGMLKGETKVFRLSDDDRTETAVRILGFRHDDLADGTGKAGITFEFADVAVVHCMNNTSANEGGWKDSDLRAWLDAEYYDCLPQRLRECIVKARKPTNNKGMVKTENDVSVVTVTEDKLWCLSMSEVYGKLSGQENVSWLYSRATYDAEGVQYQLYMDNDVSTASSVFCNKQGASSWWLRSPNAVNSDWLRVDADGDWGNDHADYDFGVSPGFCF